MINFSEYDNTVEPCCESCTEPGCGSFAEVQSQAVGEVRRATCNCGCETAETRRRLEEESAEIVDKFVSGEE